MDNQQKLVLGYWGIRGLAQPIRYLLEYLELPYEDKKYMKQEEWFGGDLLAEPFKSHNLVNLPYLKDGDKYIYESGALVLYLVLKTKRQDLLGKDAKEQVLFNQARGVINDTMTAFIRVISLSEEEYKEKGKETFQTQCGWLLDRLNRFLENKTYAVGDQLTTIDFMLFELEQTMQAYDEEYFNKLTQLKKHHTTFSNIPQIKNYLASDRFQARPFYPPGALRWC